ncbi:hypothetical protein [Pseudomonas gingeri]|uniref:Uncharacterized protein n=1 Tax=Pseudomonas gingeri TaxID=117681 RepID=A0A7Y8BMW6_9PSED|nr:hypothetical protein [Pseudomonas gingeri]NWB49544.1 hypothetical protein [Pseudomonas gingeri]
MTTAVTATKTKKSAKQRYSRRCKNPACKKVFTTTSLTKIYHAPSCKTAVGNAKKRVKHVDKATHAAFFYHLAYEVQRAGTYQVLTGHTLDSLIDLHSLYKTCLKYNNYGDVTEGETKYEMSHIAPVKGKNTLGLYRADNLVIAPMEMNRAHGTKYYGRGVSISRSEISPKYAVSKDTARSDVVAGLIQFLGETLVSDLVRVAKIQPTQRHKVMSWLLDNLNPLDPEHKIHLTALDGLSTKALTQLKATLQDKQASIFSLGTCGASPDYVLYGEWRRLANTTRPDILSMLSVLDDLYSNTSNRFYSDFSVADQQLVFDMLHGGPVSLIADLVASEVERVHSNPMLYNYTGTTTPQASIKVLATIPAPVIYRSFIEELDGNATADAPVLFMPPQAIVDSWDIPDFAK